MAKKRGKKGKSRKSRRSKDRRRSYIKKISSDGKITKKEGQKAAKKGISLRKIRNRRISDTRKAQREFDRTPRGHAPGSKRAGNRPSYNPLKIKRGAEQADRRRSESKRSSRSSPKRSSRSSSRPSSPESTAYQPNFPPQTEGLPDARTQEPSFEMPDFRGMMDEQASMYQSQFDAMRAEQAAAAEAKRLRAEEQRRQFELAQRTMLGNEARAGQQASFQLGSDPGMKRGGTYGFRRRRPAKMSGINSARTLNL